MVDQTSIRSRLGVVVVNFASCDLITANLDPLTLDESETVVVVVDNFSSDIERRRIAKSGSERGWEILTPSSNLGFGSGMNLGISRALDLGCTEILLLNPDVTLTPQSLSHLWSHARSNPASIISPTILRPDGSVWFAGGQIDLDTGTTRTRPRPGLQGSDGWLTGACLMMSAQAWTQSGGFDDRYFMYWEDVDLTRRFLSAGGQLEVLETVQAVHAVGATQGTDRKSSLYTYFVCRNRLLFASIHLDRKARIRWLLHTPAASWKIAMRDGRRSALSRPSYLWATFRGSVAGVALVIRSLLRR